MNIVDSNLKALKIIEPTVFNDERVLYGNLLG